MDFVWFLIEDVGADILDLAEAMITSNGLQYEPVSDAYSLYFLPSVLRADTNVKGSFFIFIWSKTTFSVATS